MVIYFDIGVALNLNHVVRFEVVNASCEGIFAGALLTNGDLVRIKQVSCEEEARVYICTLVKGLGGNADKEFFF